MPSTEDLILQLERKALDRWGKGGAAAHNELYASDVTYFDPLTRARIDGSKALRVYSEGSQGQHAVSRYELMNPQVIAAGELALLTYNLTTYERDTAGDEKLGSCWNCTQVYRGKGSDWKIIHSHWSHTAHEAFREPPAEGEAGA